ncbi:MAG: hypothetical protein PW843_25770 [Azospirillaceae bacterium]|nr:hypothetical protein [Azospirillaceae bacterium]
MNARANPDTRIISEPVDRRILKPEQIDAVGEALLSLTREVWILTDRVRILEAVLEDKGVDVHEAVNRYQVGPELQAELDALRKRLIDAVVAPLTGQGIQ